MVWLVRRGPDLAEIKNYVKTNLARYKVPRNATAKLLRRGLEGAGRRHATILVEDRILMRCG